LNFVRKPPTKHLPPLAHHHPGLFQPRPLPKQMLAWPIPLLPPPHNPLLKRPALDPVRLPINHHFKRSGKRGAWQPPLRMLLHVAQKYMGCVEDAGRLQIEAVAAAFGVCHADRTPSLWHESIIGEERTKTSVRTKLYQAMSLRAIARNRHVLESRTSKIAPYSGGVWKHPWRVSA
jgi:hypothetical protein